MEEENGAGGQTVCGVVGGTRLFQRFTLQKVLGRGGMGVVWLARDDRLDRLVALKLLPEAVCFDATAQDDLKRETRKSLLLTHPNIVRIFDFIEDERSAAISMEYVDGSTLSALRVEKRAKCFAVREIAPWVTSLCDALAYAHDSARVIHRDLKPSNLMVNSRMELKITDFGIACTLKDSMNNVSINTSSGTLNYMSPQQSLGADPSPADDVYAMGATLYELLSSKPPFYGGDVGTQLREIVPPWVAERRETLGIVGEAVPKHWEETIAACLAKNPADRPHSPVEIARRLRLGGTIRLAAAQQESKVLGLVQSLGRARMLGAAAGGSALIAAAILAFRASHPNPLQVKEAANAALPDVFAMEVLRPDPAAPSIILAPEPTPVATAEPSRASVVPVAAIPAPPKNAALRVATTPSGASFAIYSGVVAGTTAPNTPPVHAGVEPDSVEDLPAGRYTVFFRNEGWPEERTEVALEPGEVLPVAYVFPHGSANISSTPEGAEIFLGQRSLGKAPLTIDLPLGKQQLTARYPDRPERTQTVTVESNKAATVAFQMKEKSYSSSKKKVKPPESAFGKISQSFKNVFARKPPPKHKKG